MQIEMHYQPATPQSPRHLTREEIDAFEKANPSLARDRPYHGGDGDLGDRRFAEPNLKEGRV